MRERAKVRGREGVREGAKVRGREGTRGRMRAQEGGWGHERRDTKGGECT